MDVVDIVSLLLKFPSRNSSRATKCGSLSLYSDYVLHNVLYAPEFNYTLIFVAKLLKTNWALSIFTDTRWFLQDRFTKTLIGAGEEVYFFTRILAARTHKISTRVTSSGAL